MILVGTAGRVGYFGVMIARSILIEGKVHFREWTVKTARELDVSG